MEIKENLKNLIDTKYLELSSFGKEFNKQAKVQRTKLMTEHKKAFDVDPESVDLEAIAKDMFYLNGFYQADIRRMQVQLVDIYNTGKFAFPDLEFSEELEATVSMLKTSLPKQLFILKDGEFIELEPGRKDELIKDYTEKKYFKLFEDKLKNLLNG